VALLDECRLHVVAPDIADSGRVHEGPIGSTRLCDVGSRFAMEQPKSAIAATLDDAC
jgi:hypothetical protein